MRSLKEKLRNDLMDIRSEEDFAQTSLKIKSLARSLSLMQRENKVFVSYAADLLALLSSEEQFRARNKSRTGDDNAFFKSFAMLRDEILKHL